MLRRSGGCISQSFERLFRERLILGDGKINGELSNLGLHFEGYLETVDFQESMVLTAILFSKRKIRLGGKDNLQ
ncbi:hypothetical protein GWI33_009570 [Rhynchophorus ferrugineus]|uniref:Uncharacterized protein n=1 Tax=Rhynchophorus ferrugineus TaxID=354439 RepID=A0A834IN08_RHYFE|nr:hypothetical protein GWI33_009570 [Rhynchophorus ferrugineus]